MRNVVRKHGERGSRLSLVDSCVFVQVIIHNQENATALELKHCKTQQFDKALPEATRVSGRP